MDNLFSHRALDAARALRPVDLIDIALVAGLLYVAFLAVRRARARFAILGLGLLGLAYLALEPWGVYLTSAIVEAALPVAAVALVIVFQDDLRRGFERVAVGFRGGQSIPPAAADTLVGALTHLAARRIGSLVVLRGTEPLHRHTVGGIRLDGRLSAPLLHSLFDPHSAGHDGAVLLAGDIVESFGVHLPLSSTPDGPPERGTRHAAALGLSERSDALVLVTSEERGTLSVARGGSLWEVTDAGALKTLIEEHGRPHRAPKPKLWTPGRMRRLAAQSVCALLAFVGWLAFAATHDEIAVRSFELPIVYRNVPEHRLLSPPEPQVAEVVVSGPAPELRDFARDPGALEIDVSDLPDGARRVSLVAGQLDLHPSLVLEQAQPASVRVVSHEAAPVEVPVVPALRAGGRRVVVSPARVKLLVAKGAQDRIDHIRTQAIEGVPPDDAPRKVGLVVPEGARLAPGEPSEVEVAPGPLTPKQSS